jgi:hypothetical protein
LHFGAIKLPKEAYKKSVVTQGGMMNPRKANEKASGQFGSVSNGVPSILSKATAQLLLF